MLHKTRGIVLQNIKYSENSNILKIYTEVFGLKSYIIRGLRKAKSKNKASLFQHLSLLELVVYNKEKQSVQNIKEVKPAYLFTEIPFDIKKSSVVLFINELINKSIREEEANPPLFEFLYNSIVALDKMQEGASNFHLIFALKFTKYLGFFPHGFNIQNAEYFDLREGLFQKNKPTHPDYISREKLKIFKLVFKLDFENPTDFKANNIQRNDFLQNILFYYQIHLPVFSPMKSIEVLHSVFN